ncbi:fatty acyl-CoA hydrolase precursor, medium chain-like isoform X2 [Saccostrea echinata]|uniref:fatty acyl-CoA hydrolase precursor, medium chain-like isoform X2 n=1 Tax=Saccostrea echinata TaxID=191078 RepID=UPI002A825F5D|nr:fatty acyl-CoA hydrolase precursor, medium chain-like isoform X2 [Saccostrea echinata]
MIIVSHLLRNFSVFVFLIFCVIKSTCLEYVTKSTKYGKVRGSVETVYSGKKIERFLGVPYASPPLNELRFEHPVPPDPWNDVLDALEIPPACPQPGEGVAYIEYHVPDFNHTSEDCLYLNIYSPKNSNKSKKYPVLFFVHGGSYFNGMGAMFEGTALSASDIVVVTINYRLGPLGFLASGDPELAGNYGMMDMIAALWWVRKNIEVFNGDPDQVTLMGHSAGGCSVGFLMMSPLTNGLFRRAIVQSGSPLAHWSYSEKVMAPNIHFKIFISSIGCLQNSSRHIKECLQKIPTDVMHKHISYKYVTSPSLTPQFRPVVDGYILPDIPERLIKTGNFRVESVMTGATEDEGLNAVPLVGLFGGNEEGIKQLITLMYCFQGDLPSVANIVDMVLDQYLSWPLEERENFVQDIFSDIVGDYYITAPTHKFAQLMSLRNTPVYLYNYEYKSILAQSKGVTHGSEIFYLSGFPTSGHSHFRFDDIDKKMSKLLIHMWSNFIYNGLPSLVPHRQYHMNRYRINNPVYTKIYQGINRPFIESSTDYKAKKLDFWNNKIPLYSETVSSDVIPSPVQKTYVITGPDHWALIAACIGLAGLVMCLAVGYCRAKLQLQNLHRQHCVCIAGEITSKDLKKSKYFKTNV